MTPFKKHVLILKGANDKGPGFRRGLSHLAGSGLQPVGEIQNGLAAARQAVLEALLADRPAGVAIGAAQVVAGAARVVLAILLPFCGQLFRGAEGGRQLAHLAKVVAAGLGETQQDAPGHAMREVVGHDVALILAQLGDDVALGPFRRVFLPEGLAAAFQLAALLIRLGLLLGTNLIGLQNGLIQGLAAGLILAKLRIGVPVDDGAVRLGDKLSRNLIPQGGHHSLPAWDDSSRCLRLKCKLLPKKSPSNTGTHITYHLLMVPCCRTAYDTVTEHT